jgi:hypothetical protein
MQPTAFGRAEASIARHVLEKADLRSGLVDLDPGEEPEGDAAR